MRSGLYNESFSPALTSHYIPLSCALTRNFNQKRYLLYTRHNAGGRLDWQTLNKPQNNWFSRTDFESVSLQTHSCGVWPTDRHLPVTTWPCHEANIVHPLIHLIKLPSFALTSVLICPWMPRRLQQQQQMWVSTFNIKPAFKFKCLGRNFLF